MVRLEYAKKAKLYFENWKNDYPENSISDEAMFFIVSSVDALEAMKGNLLIHQKLSLT